VKFNFIKCNSEHDALRTMCHVMGASQSEYYGWVKRPDQLISADTLH